MAAGQVRVDGARVAKASHALRPGATLTFPQGRRIRVIRVEALAGRRGPAPEARALYTDLAPPEDRIPENPRYEGKGRPSGKDRRNARLLRRGTLE